MPKTGSIAAKNSQKKGGGRGPGKPFKKNDPVTGEKDPRINREGKPQIFPELRKMVIGIFHERLMTKDPKDPDGKKFIESERTQLEAMLRMWLLSQDYNKQNRLLEYGFGKVPDEIRQRTDEEEFVNRYIHVFTDGELERIKNGENGFEILLSKLEEAFGPKE